MEKFKGTQGEWSLPHLANDSTNCNCCYVLSEGIMGCLATIQHQGNQMEHKEEYPTLEEAKANAQLISAAPELLEALQDLYYKMASMRDLTPMTVSQRETIENSLDSSLKAINKALGL